MNKGAHQEKKVICNSRKIVRRYLVPLNNIKVNDFSLITYSVNEFVLTTMHIKKFDTEDS
jgi:hypothetical protein